jgi:hypothetical protein
MNLLSEVLRQAFENNDIITRLGYDLLLRISSYATKCFY